MALDQETDYCEYRMKSSKDMGCLLYTSNVRHKTALQNALQSLNNVIQSIDMQMPEDFYSIDLMDAYETLGSITGETIGEDLVNEIFSKFCIDVYKRQLLRHSLLPDHPGSHLLPLLRSLPDLQPSVPDQAL